MSAEGEIGFLPFPLKRSCKPLQLELGYKYLCTMYKPIRVEFCLQSTLRIEIFQSTKLSSGVRWYNSSLIMAEFEAAAKLNQDSSKGRGRLVFFSFTCNHSPSHGSMLLYVVSTEFSFLFFFSSSWHARLSPATLFG